MRMFRSIRTLSLALLMLAAPLASFAGVFFSASFGPPELPYYEQPLCPGDGYIWTPGYWAYGDEGYFWVPGTWVMAPRVGYLWTPGYWGWGGNEFLFHEGYWGSEIGFYGGINYGFGYGGRGYEGGFWDHDRFRYNQSVNNINTTNITNVYNKTIINNNNAGRVAYNGGNGGLNVRPTTRELAVVQAPHIKALPVQIQHQQLASTNREQFASVNHGQPKIAATPRATAFNDKGVVPARPSNTNTPANLGNRGAVTGRPAPTLSGSNGSHPVITARPNGAGAVNGGATNRPTYQPGNQNNAGRVGTQNTPRPLITAHPGGSNGAAVNGNRPAYEGTANGRNGSVGSNQNTPRPLVTARPNGEGQGQNAPRPQYAPRANSQPQYAPRQNSQPQYAPRENTRPSQPQYAPRQNSQPQYAPRENTLPSQPQYAPRQNSQPQYAPRENSAPRQNAAPQHYNAPPQHYEAPRSAPAPRNESAPRPPADQHGQPHGGR